MIDNQGENLRRVLKEKHIKQQKFADMFGVTRGYVHQMFAKRRFSDETIMKICTVLNIGIEELNRQNVQNIPQQVESTSNHTKAIWEIIETMKRNNNDLKEELNRMKEAQERLQKDHYILKGEVKTLKELFKKPH
jgi:transcriptional regulator with XRE-family HTH domain